MSKIAIAKISFEKENINDKMEKFSLKVSIFESFY